VFEAQLSYPLLPFCFCTLICKEFSTLSCCDHAQHLFFFHFSITLYLMTTKALDTINRFLILGTNLGFIWQFALHQ